MCILDLQQSTQPQVIANITVSDSVILSAAAIPTKPDSSDMRPLVATAAAQEREEEEEEGAIALLGPTISITSVTSSDSRASSNSCLSRDSHVIMSRTSSMSSVDDSITVLKSESQLGMENENENTPQNGHVSNGEVPCRGPDVVVESLNTMSKQMKQRGESPQALKLGFHRVRSNSAPSFPDVQTIAQEAARKSHSPSLSSGGGRGYKRSESTSRLWSPLSLVQSDLDVEGGGRDHCMWLGTEEGKILIYSAGNNLRSRSTRETLELPAPVHCIR